jgi:anaphase-promoting complex subunit 10
LIVLPQYVVGQITFGAATLANGATSHIINIHFIKKVAVTHVCLYVDYSLDESYTAKRISIRTGSNMHDMIDVTTFELSEPSGWVVAEVSSLVDATLPANTEHNNKSPLLTHLLQVRVLTMHQNGRDTHIRQIKILGPRASPIVMGGLPLSDFKSVEMLQYAVLR